jgi:hypothetical protein
MVKQINNFNFIAIPCPTAAINKNKQDSTETIIVEDGNCPINYDYSLISTIFRSDSTIAFKILSPLKTQE